MTNASDNSSNAAIDLFENGAPVDLGDVALVDVLKTGPTVRVRSSASFGHTTVENMGVGDTFVIESDGVVIGRLLGIEDRKGRFAVRMEAVDTRDGGWCEASAVVRRGQWVERDQSTGLFSPVVDGVAVAQLAFATESEAQATLTALRAVGHI